MPDTNLTPYKAVCNGYPRRCADAATLRLPGRVADTSHARAWLAERGWSFLGADVDLCPACTDRRAAVLG